MHLRRRPPHCLLLAAFLASPPAATATPAAAAQDPSSTLRGRVFGWVEDRSGARVAGARVLLAARPIHNRWDSGEPDVVGTVTGGDGRFDAMLLPARPYSAWAVLDPDGEAPGPDSQGEARPAPRTTQVVEGIFPGTPVRLVEGPPAVRVRLRIHGREAWSHQESLPVRAMAVSAAHLVVPLEADEQGEFPLPPLPGARCRVEVFTMEGMPLVSRLVPLLQEDRGSGPARPGAADDGAADDGVEEAPDDADAPDSPDVTTLFLPPPLELPVTVAGAGHGRPVADAEVFLAHRTSQGVRLHLLGRTDEDGQCVVRIPASTDDSGRLQPTVMRLIHVRAAGHASLEAQHRPQQHGEPVLPLRVELPAGCAVRGRLALAEDLPAAGLRVLAEGSLHTGPQSLRSGAVSHAVTDAEGRFEIPGVGRGSVLRLSVFLPEDLATGRGLGSPGGPPLLPHVLLGAWAAPPEGDLDVGGLDLARLRRLDVVVRAWDGAPAAGARILVGEVAMGAGMGLWSLFEGRCDRVGRLRLLVPREELFAGAVDSSGTLANASLESLAGEDLDQALTLTLGRPIPVEGSVTDFGGRPVEGATVTARLVFMGFMGGGADRARHRFLSAAPPGSVASGHDGRFRLLVGQPFETYNVRATLRVEGRFLYSANLRVEVGEEPVTGVHLELDVPPR